MARRGRLSRYETYVLPHIDEIREWVTMMNEAEIAGKLGICVSSLEKYKREHDELREALRGGRSKLVEELKSSLRQKAKGFEYTEIKETIRMEAGKQIKTVERYTRYSPPDTAAIHLLLKNLCDDWRNDDAETMKMKREKLALDRQKAEAETW